MKNLSTHITEAFINEAAFKYKETPEWLAFYNKITDGHSKIPMSVVKMVLPMFKDESGDFIKDWLATYVKDKKELSELQSLVDAYFKAHK